MITNREKRLAHLNFDLERLENEKKNAAAHYKELIDLKRKEISGLSTEILQGKESLFGSSGAATIDADDAGNVTISIPANAEQD